MKASVLVLVAVTSVATGLGIGDEPVHISSKYGQLITSSTLHWVKRERGERPENAVIGSEEIVPGDNTNGQNEQNINEVLQRPVYICRARHNGEWVAGGLRAGHPACHVPLVGRVFQYDRYEVLENQDGAARLSWQHWKRFSEVPEGAVSAGDIFVARRKVEDSAGGSRVLGFTHLLGHFDNRDSFQGKITVVNQRDEALEFHDGEVLVETEPTSYVLDVVSFNANRRKVLRESRSLGTTQIRNGNGAYPVILDSAMAYDANHSLYYGRGNAMLRGLHTSVHLPGGKAIHHTKWGIEESREFKDVHKVEARLDPGTAVNVTLVGNYTITETPYTAKLKTVYADGETRVRTITEVKIEKAMLDVHPEFSPAYWLHNDSLVPTTSTSTTSSTSTSTTTSTTSTTEASTSQEPKMAKKTLPGQRDAIKGENNSMMSDDGSNSPSAKAHEAHKGVLESTTGVGAGASLSPSHLAILMLACAVRAAAGAALRIG